MAESERWRIEVYARLNDRDHPHGEWRAYDPALLPLGLVWERGAPGDGAEYAFYRPARMTFRRERMALGETTQEGVRT